MKTRRLLTFVFVAGAAACSPPEGPGGNNRYQPTGAGTGNPGDTAAADPGTQPVLNDPPPASTVPTLPTTSPTAPPPLPGTVPPPPAGFLAAADDALLACPKRGSAKAWQRGTLVDVNMCSHTYRVRVAVSPLPELVWDAGAARDGIDEGLGFGWRVPQDQSLEVALDGSAAKIYGIDNDEVRFSGDGTGNFTAEPYVYVSLVRVDANTIVVKNPDGGGREFKALASDPGSGGVRTYRLTMSWNGFDDRAAGNGKTSRVVYERDTATNQLTAVRPSTVGAGKNWLTFVWAGTHVQSMTWQDSRTVTFEYVASQLNKVDTDAMGSYTIAFDSGSKRVTQVTDANGEITKYDADATSWLIISHPTPGGEVFAHKYASTVSAGVRSESDVDEDGYGGTIEFICFKSGCNPAFGQSDVVYTGAQVEIPSGLRTQFRRNSAGYLYQTTSEKDGTSTTWTPAAFGDAAPGVIGGVPQVTVKNVTASGSTKALAYVATQWNEYHMASRVATPGAIEEYQYEYQKPGGGVKWDRFGLWRHATRTKANNGTTDMKVVGLTEIVRRDAPAGSPSADAVYAIDTKTSPINAGVETQWLDVAGRRVAIKKAGSGGAIVTTFDGFGYATTVDDKTSGALVTTTYGEGGIPLTNTVKACGTQRSTSTATITGHRVVATTNTVGDPASGGYTLTEAKSNFTPMGDPKLIKKTFGVSSTTETTTRYFNRAVPVGRDVTIVTPDTTVSQSWRWNARGYSSP